MQRKFCAFRSWEICCRIHRPHRLHRHSTPEWSNAFSLITVMQILYSQNKNRPSTYGDFKAVIILLGLFCYQKFIIFLHWTYLTFWHTYAINNTDWNVKNKNTLYQTWRFSQNIQFREWLSLHMFTRYSLSQLVIYVNSVLINHR